MTFQQTRLDQQSSHQEQPYAFKFFEANQWKLTNQKAQAKIVHEHFDFEKSNFDLLNNNGGLLLFRLILLIPSITLTVLAIMKLPVLVPWIFLTWWGNHLITFALILSIISGTKGFSGNFELKRHAAILTQLALPVQLVIVLIYWPVLSSKDF